MRKIDERCARRFAPVFGEALELRGQAHAGEHRRQRAVLPETEQTVLDALQFSPGGCDRRHMLPRLLSGSGGPMVESFNADLGYVPTDVATVARMLVPNCSADVVMNTVQ
mgnify:CR=1 FL=1